MISDLILDVLIGYTSIGIMLFFVETFAELEFYDTILYEFPRLDKISTAIMLFLGCVGAWPMIIIFEIMNRGKNGRKG